MDPQAVVSKLARRLGKSVALNDFDLGLLAASAQELDVDEYRVESILRRRTPPNIIALLRERGDVERGDPFVIEGNTLPGMRPRMCIPIALNRRNVAFLWIILDSDVGLSSTEYAYARAAAEKLAEMLASRAPAPGLDTIVSNTRRLQRLIHRDAVTAGYTVAELVSEHEIDDQAPLTTTVMQLESVVSEDQDGAGKPPDLAKLAAAGLTALGRSGLIGVIDGALVFVSTTSSPLDLAQRVERSLESGLKAAGYGVRSSGTASTREWKEGLREVYFHAAYASRVAGLIPEAPRHSSYGDLGALMLLRDIPWTRESVAHISPEACAQTSQGSRVNTHTLLAYLRAAGDTQRTCVALNIHRTTLYYRLGRCRQHIGDALDDGWRRTSLYLGLLLADLAAQTADPVS